MSILVLFTDKRCEVAVFTFCYVLHAVNGVTTTKTCFTKTNLNQ